MALPGPCPLKLCPLGLPPGALIQPGNTHRLDVKVRGHPAVYHFDHSIQLRYVMK